jgi:hypothetical protein
MHMTYLSYLGCHAMIIFVAHECRESGVYFFWCISFFLCAVLATYCFEVFAL